MENRIKTLIKEKGFTQEQFAQKMGVTRMSLVKTLSGNPSYETFQRIAETLGVEMWELFASKEQVIKQNKNSIPCPYCGKPIDVSLLNENEAVYSFILPPNFTPEVDVNISRTTALSSDKPPPQFC